MTGFYMNCNSGLKCVKQNPSIQHLPCHNKIYRMIPREILKLLKELDAKKTVGFDMVPPKLVKIAL